MRMLKDQTIRRSDALQLHEGLQRLAIVHKWRVLDDGSEEVPTMTLERLGLIEPPEPEATEPALPALIDDDQWDDDDDRTDDEVHAAVMQSIEGLVD